MRLLENFILKICHFDFILLLGLHSQSSLSYKKFEDSIRISHIGSSFGRREKLLSSNPRASQDEFALSQNRGTENSPQQTPGWKLGISLGSNAYSMDLRKSSEFDSRQPDENDEKSKNLYELRQRSPCAAKNINPFFIDFGISGIDIFCILNPSIALGANLDGNSDDLGTNAVNNAWVISTTTETSNFKPYITANTKVIKEVDKNDSFHLKYVLESQLAMAKSIKLNSAPIPNEFEQIFEDIKKDHKLKIYLQSYTTSEKTTTSKVMAEWYVPATPDQFIKFMNNVNEQLNISDGIVETIKPVLVMNESPDQVYILYYVSYKKTTDGNARDFVYMRHSAKIDASSYADCLVSVEHPDYPIITNYNRCEYKLGGHVVKLASDKNNQKPISLVRMYLELDYKDDLPIHLARSYVQVSLKEYIEKSIERLKVLNPNK